MARTRSSARRYAEAAFEIAERDGTVDEWLKDLQRIEKLLESEDVLAFLQNPAIPATTRVEAARRALEKGVDDKPRNLMLLLIKRGRIEVLPRVVAEFRRLYERREGIVQAVVVSAAALDDAEVKAIRDRLGKLTSGRIELTREVDPSILGGVLVRLGDVLIDGSVRGRLERLRNRLAAGAI